ncbi:MAG: hypothetical protein II473_07045 [Clostridia bacterium]|nr:hypothetical protein [Clostridia bacterium]MBQ2092924.1 hypothetical protein [Clostridia bacterium]
MKILIILNAFTCLCALAGAIYGIVCIFQSKRPMYFTMIVASVGITAFSRLYEVVYMWTAGEYFRGFHIGILGTIGTFLFVFTANYGAMDTLCDDGSDKFKKYRLAALAAPLVTAALYLPILMSKSSVEIKICFGFICAVIMMASYFNLKHLIIPDVDYGVIKCIRGYNLLMLIAGLFYMLELLGIAFNLAVLLYVSTACIGVISLLVVPVLKRGAEKWAI